MKKLNLNKQEVFELSKSEQNDIRGGGLNRSNRRGGDCRYSRNNPSYDPESPDGMAIISCGVSDMG